MRKRPHTQGFLLWVSLIYTWAVSSPAPVKRINLERTTGHIVPLVSPKLALPSSIAPWQTEVRDIPVFPSATHAHIPPRTKITALLCADLFPSLGRSVRLSGPKNNTAREEGTCGFDQEEQELSLKSLSLSSCSILSRLEMD